MLYSIIEPLDVAGLYPIEGILRDSLLLIETLIILLSGELSIILRIRETKFRRKYKTKSDEGVFSILFLAWAFLWLFKLIGDFFIIDLSVRIRIISLGYILSTLGILRFLYYMEKKIFEKLRPFSIILIVLILIMLAFWFIDPYFAEFISYLLWIPFIFTYFPYIKTMRKIFSINKNSIIFFAMGFILAAIGYIGTIDLTISTFQNFTIRYISDLATLFGLLILIHFFLRISTFLEYNWKGNIIKIIIYYGNGVTVFDYDFEDKIKNLEQDESNLSMNTALFGIQNFLKNSISKSTPKPVENFELEIGYVMLEYGEYITAVAICEKRLTSIRILLKRLVTHIEKVYSNELPDWRGDLSKLSSIKDIFKSTFLVNNGKK